MCERGIFFGTNVSYPLSGISKQDDIALLLVSGLIVVLVCGNKIIALLASKF